MTRPRQLADCPPDGEDWYANLLWLSGRKCLLVTHAVTLFSVFEADVRAAGLRDPGRLVTGLIGRELRREQLPAETFGNMDPASVSLAKTADRSVLGCMNDMAFMCEASTDRSGGLATTDLADLNQAPAPDPAAATPLVLGVDDFALRKGQIYGTAARCC